MSIQNEYDFNHHAGVPASLDLSGRSANSVISVVICSIDDKKFSIVRAHYQAAIGDELELIRVSDARSMSEGCNRGIAQSRGEIVIISHDDVELLTPEQFKPRLLGHLSSCDLLGILGTQLLVGPAWAVAGPPYLVGQLANHVESDRFDLSIVGAPRRLVHEVQAIDGVLMAMRRTVLDRLRFDERFTDFHHYDIDFSFSAHLLGLRVAVANDLNVAHPARRGWNANWERSAMTFLEKHASVLPNRRVWDWHGAMVKGLSRDELLPLMEAPHWRDEGSR